jgi:hypothetical protein
MIPISSRAVLLAWARWGAIQNLGYPALSPMFGERALKTPLYASTYAPPDVLEMDRAVGMVEPGERRIIIHRYLWRMSHTELGERWGLTRNKARHRLEAAEYAVHAAYISLNSRAIYGTSAQDTNAANTMSNRSL